MINRLHTAEVDAPQCVDNSRTNLFAGEIPLT